MPLLVRSLSKTGVGPPAIWEAGKRKNGIIRPGSPGVALAKGKESDARHTAVSHRELESE